MNEADPTHDGEHGAGEEEAEAVGVLARLEEEVQAHRGGGHGGDGVEELRDVGGYQIVGLDQS